MSTVSMHRRGRVSWLGAVVRRDRWSYWYGWPYGTQLRPRWVMYFGRARWTRAELDEIKARAAALAARLAEVTA